MDNAEVRLSLLLQDEIAFLVPKICEQNRIRNDEDTLAQIRCEFVEPDVWVVISPVNPRAASCIDGSSANHIEEMVTHSNLAFALRNSISRACIQRIGVFFAGLCGWFFYNAILFLAFFVYYCLGLRQLRFGGRLSDLFISNHGSDADGYGRGC